ncbi:MAG: acetyl-CoA carboxylase biotin carboxyl carrier protein subunit [Anaerolineae bacterium]|nr:acetyl-CoA carboxylase biotin carboxyl carrier protein subunit [Anaerolineae bacterium]
MKLTKIPFKTRVQIEGQVFEVEVGDLDARPIVATVDGQRFEVWPGAAEMSSSLPASTPAASRPEVVDAPVSAPIPRSAPGTTPALGGDKALEVRAPIPGVIVAIAVRPDAKVQIGDQLCVLEAMKMRNAIRATRAGEIAEVHVTVGQHVKHQELLLEFAP